MLWINHVFEVIGKCIGKQESLLEGKACCKLKSLEESSLIRFLNVNTTVQVKNTIASNIATHFPECTHTQIKFHNQKAR